MQLKTSFFNKTVLKKDITRFAPIWALYTVFLLLMLFEFGDYPPAVTALNLLEFTAGMAILNALYAGVCAAFLFMDLFNGRLCNALHAFPLQRKNWLANHILSGVLFSLVPNLLATLVALPLLWEYAYIAPIWLAVTTLQFLFFFGSAVLCAMCAGNLIGMGALYGIFHLGVILIGGVAELFYQPLLHGVQLTIDSFTRFIPLYQMNRRFQYAAFRVMHQKLDPYGVFSGLIGKDWLYLGLCAAAGVVCVWLAWLVYRKRNLESAGDLLAVKKLSPLFLLICTVGAGAVLYLFSGSFGTRSYVFLVIGTIIGYFAGRMLLSRTIKVFTKRAFMGFGIIVAVAAASFLLTWLDPVGVTRYVPELDQIESATMGEHFYLEVNGLQTDSFKITDKNELAELQDFHRQLIQHRPKASNSYTSIYIHYNLANGQTVKRFYKIARNSDLENRAIKYFSDIRHIFNVADPQSLYNAFEIVKIEGTSGTKALNTTLTDQEQINGLIDAIQKDCEAGQMAQEFYYRRDYGEESYYLQFPTEDDYVASKVIWVGPNCTNTFAYLKQIITEDWQDTGTIVVVK